MHFVKLELTLNSTQAVHLSMLLSFGWYDSLIRVYTRYTISIWVCTLHSDMLLPYLGMVFSFGHALFIWVYMLFSFDHALNIWVWSFHLGMLFSFVFLWWYNVKMHPEWDQGKSLTSLVMM